MANPSLQGTRRKRRIRSRRLAQEHLAEPTLATMSVQVRALGPREVQAMRDMLRLYGSAFAEPETCLEPSQDATQVER